MNHYPGYDVLSEYHRNHLSKSSERCAIVFDIDGTLIDPRVMQLVVLKAYDQVNETSWFNDKELNDLTIYEIYIRQQLMEWTIPVAEIDHICEFYQQNHWSEQIAVSYTHLTLTTIYSV